MGVDEAIKVVFPTGLLHEPAFDEARIDEVRQQVLEIAETLSQLTSLQISHQLRFPNEHYFNFGSTLAPAPTADEWIWGHRSPDKLAFVAKNGGDLPLWWVKFSFVYPVWCHYFNLWSPRPSDPKFLDVNFTMDAPNAEWETTLMIAERIIASYGFSRISSTEHNRRIEFVRYEEFSDDDLDADNCVPQLQICTVGQCLFSEC